MEPPRLYIETSIISYLTARPSNDLVAMGHQALTSRWWDEGAQNSASIPLNWLSGNLHKAMNKRLHDDWQCWLRFRFSQFPMT